MDGFQVVDQVNDKFISSTRFDEANQSENDIQI